MLSWLMPTWRRLRQRHQCQPCHQLARQPLEQLRHQTVVDKQVSFFSLSRACVVLHGEYSTLQRLTAMSVAIVCLVACGRTPDSKPIIVPKAVGHRESVYGKSMDQAEALKEKVADYNASLEQAIDQGTKAEPPPKKTPGAQPAPPQ
jgi:hypothetical protein